MLLMEGARAAVVTVSDGVTRGTRTDESGDVAASLLRDAGFDVVTREVVPDEGELIEQTLRRLAAAHALVVTTGGTGFGPRDVTPEATRAVIDREAPGLAELMRTAGLVHTPMAALSRAVAGVAGEALVVNLPAAPGASRNPSRRCSPSCRTRCSCWAAPPAPTPPATGSRRTSCPPSTARSGER
jgi:molybdopterin adenylyltransferase